MDDNPQGQHTEFNNFKSQLSGLLATLQKLPVGEKETAINLLKVTVNHHLEDSLASKDRPTVSESERRFFYQDGDTHCSLQSRVKQESECEFEQHPNTVTEVQVIDESLCLNHEVPQSQLHPQDLNSTIGENISFNILHHLSDTDSLDGSTLSDTDAGKNSTLSKKNDTHLGLKDSRSKKEQDGRRKDVSSEQMSIDTCLNSQSSCCLKDDSVINQKEDGILIQMASESQKHLLEDRALYNLHNELKDDDDQHNVCLDSLEKYSEVLNVSEQDRLLSHGSDHAAVPLLDHSDQQLSLITSREFCDGTQDVSDLGTILDAQDHDRNLSVLEEQNEHHSQDYASEESLLHLKIISEKQEDSDGKLDSSDKRNPIHESSCSTLNFSHFPHLNDRNNLYSEENSYLLPYLERDTYEKLGYKLENISKKSDEDDLEKSLGASYNGDDIDCNERSTDTLVGLEPDKTPVDLSSTTSNVQDVRHNTPISMFEETQDSSHHSQEMESRTDANLTSSESQESTTKAPQRRTRSQNKRQTRPDKHKSISLKEDVVVEMRELHQKDDTENLDISRTSFQSITLKDMNDGTDINHCHDNKTRVSANDDSMNVENKKNSTEGNDDNSMEIDVQDDSLNLVSNTSEDKGEESQSSNLQPVSCRNCKKELPDFLLFLVHQRQCEGHFSCPICFAKFIQKVTYARHMQGHKRNVCSKCSKSFCSHKKLKAHMKTEHNFDLISKSYPCDLCSRTFLKRSSLFYHLKNHAGDDEEVCQKCGLFCKGKEAFDQHMAEHYKATNFHCHICSASFRRRQQYNDHLRHHKKNECEICREPFTTRRALVRHCRLVHNTLPQNITLHREYKCDQCDRVFNRPSLLRHHLQLHRGVKLECRLCNKQFSHKRGLQKHMNSIMHEHTLLTNNLQKDHAYDTKQNYAYTCEYCDLKLPTKYLLSTHSRLAHKEGITWHCPHCEYTTKRNNTLKRHMQLHLESRNFMCEICGSSFQALATLKDHYNFVHSDERNYKCTECNKTFKNKSSLARHSRTHSDDRPYKCHCGTTYKRLSHLKRHSSSAHKETMKSRAVKKLKRSEDSDVTASDPISWQEVVASKDYYENEDFEFVPVTSCSLSPVIQTNPSMKSDILLPASESIIVMSENSNSEQGHLITVGDSQIIQLIPSTFQFPQDSSFQTVSLVPASDLQTIPLPTTSSYGQGQGGHVVVEPFSLPQTSDTMVMVPAGHTLGDTDTIPATLHTLDNEALVESTRIGRESSNPSDKQEIDLSTLESHAELPISPGLDTYTYTSGTAAAAGVASPQTTNLLPALPPPHFITHAHSHTTSQDILQSGLICTDFVLPVDGNR